MSNALSGKSWRGWEACRHPFSNASGRPSATFGETIALPSNCWLVLRLLTFKAAPAVNPDRRVTAVGP